MGELNEFAEALLDQLSVEINEEKEISELSAKIKDDPTFTVIFDSLEKCAHKIFPQMLQKVNEFTGISAPALKLEFVGLNDFKKLKGRKVFTTEDARPFVEKLFDAVIKESPEKIVELIKQDTPKFLVFSTYAKSYISKISTTYGDYLDSSIYLNKFILSSYPHIILYKQGKPFESKFNKVNSGYMGALKMTILEEQIHSIQDNLTEKNIA